MCGINGVYAYHYAANPIDKAELERTRDHMTTRGPDGKGTWISNDDRVGLAHRRLSIIDLSETGAQPMASADGKLVVTFNGEIYNYKELRYSLEARGHVFQSQSDTEVLLHLYAVRGAAMVHELRGMFAFALWDKTRRRMLLARDPYGIKPLYYSDSGRALRFASQVKALIAGGAISREQDPAGLVGFYLLGSVPEPFTLYRAIRALPAGCTLIAEAGGVREPDRYHSIARVFSEAERIPAAKPEDVVEYVRAALLDSVRHHLVADVPVGVFLSAGIDSGALTGLMRDANQSETRSVTIGFDEFTSKREDELPLAAEVAQRYGTCHTARRVTAAEFRTDLPQILEAMDQPSIDGINAWFVAKATREVGLKVAISGLGGDELFAGYPSFRDVPRWVRLMSTPSRVPLAGTLSRRLLSTLRLERMGVNPKLAGMVELGGDYPGAYLLRRGLFMPWEIAELIGREMAQEGLRSLAPIEMIRSVIEPEPREPLSKVGVLEASLYMRNQLLRDADWASMAHGIEVRLPLVDVRLLADLAPVMTHEVTRLSKRQLANAPSVALPDVVADRAKTGFLTPIAQWIERLSIDGQRHHPAQGANREHWSRRWARQIEFRFKESDGGPTTVGLSGGRNTSRDAARLVTGE